MKNTKSKEIKSPFNILFFIVLLTVCQKSFGQSNSADHVDSVIRNTMQSKNLVGIAAAIIIDKKLVWAKGYGYADRENRISFTPNTLMNIASISKTFTGVCLMKAVEQGKLSLDADINIYLPFKLINPNFPNEKITLRHLATHTSGLADRYPFYLDSTYFYGGATPEPLGQFLQNYFCPGGKYYLNDNFLNYKPGTYRDYSNIAAGLAGYIVELQTGKKLGEYAKQHIFLPLKMSNSGWSLADININHHSKLYKKQGDSTVKIPLYEGTTYPDGGVRTSVSELSKFFICLLNEGQFEKTRILKKQSVEEMTRLQFTEANKPENVKVDKLNSGIFWSTRMGATRIGHNGSDPGVRTFMLSDLSKEIGIVLFFNTSLSTKEDGIFFDVYNELYKYAQTLKNNTAQR